MPTSQLLTLDAIKKLLTAGQIDDAAQQCLSVLQKEPKNTQVKHLYAVALILQGRAVDAVAILDALASQPESIPEIHLDLAVARANAGFVDEAIVGLRRAAGLPRQIPQTQQFLDHLLNVPYLPATALQGSHAPERQAYMAAAVHLKRELNRPLRILEVGSYMGASALTWGAAVSALTGHGAELNCVDAWEGADLGQYSADMATRLKQGAAYRIFLNNVRHIPNKVTVKHIVGLSHDVLPTLSGKFDLIYVDACHLYEEMSADLKLCHGLVEEGGFICGDDLELQINEIDAASARKNLRTDYVLDPATGQYFHPGVTLAVAETYGPVSVYRGFWIMQRVAGGYAKVSLAGATGWLPRHWPASSQQRVRDAVAADRVLAGLI